MKKLRSMDMKKLIYIYMCGAMVDFGKSDKMITIRKVNKSNTYKEFRGNISFFVHNGLKYLKKFLGIKNELLPLNPL